ncbi:MULTISPECIES: hypothetical protein [unclassified Microcoleus]|uniref:hypothetical protein n=1 Tax=unclassified Microcoleus TaxID=2642155 RepID=UPI0025F3F8BC|nr:MULTISPECIES: hypothetical protein [unclassified Microcoleus]
MVRSKPITAQINSIGAGIIAEGRRKKEDGRRKMQAGMPAAFQFFILALLSKQPPLYGFLVLKPG